MGYHPHAKPKNKHKTLDALVGFVAIASPLMTLPQVFQIFSTQNATGVSLASWTAFTISSSIWLFYGLAHRERPIVLNSVIGGTLSLITVLGVAMFG